MQNNPISPNQPGFKTRNSCINQLLSTIISYYYKPDISKVRSVFLDIYKAFKASGSSL